MELLRNTFLSILFFTLFVLNGCFGEMNHSCDRHGTQQRTNSDSLSRTFTDTSLVTIMRMIGENTNMYFTIIGAGDISKIKNNLMQTLLKDHHHSCYERLEESRDTDDLIINCKWKTSVNTQVLTVKTMPRDPNSLSLAVHDGKMPLPNPLKSIEDVCSRHFCPVLTFPNLCPDHGTRETTIPCESTTNDNKGKYDASKGNCSQSGGVDVIPIVIASIASFIAGIVACLLSLCILRHCRKRPCFKSSTSEDGLSKPKQHQETYEGLQAQSKGKNIPEYIGLQDVNPESRTELGAKRPQPSAPQQAIVYETSDKRRSEHVYSELGNKPTNGPGEYESTFPNRSSDHVYQGIQGNTNPDISSRHQTNELPENKRGNKGHINGAMGQDRYPISETNGADGCYPQKHDYFVLEKENHKPNESGMSAGTKSDGQGFLSGSLQSEPDDKNTQHNDYFVLEKETHNPNESGMSAGAKSDGQGCFNDSLQSEPDDKNTQPNDYFVLEKENKAVNEGERVEDIKIDDTHLEADDDVDGDYHSYHVLEKQ